MPHDFKRLPALVNLGYFFINFITPDVAVEAMNKFVGFKDWPMDSSKVLSASWDTQTQGQKACIKWYRNCPAMHEAVPVECKPMIFENGVMVPLSPSKKKIKQPFFKKALLVDDASLSTDAPQEPNEDSLANVSEAYEECRADVECKSGQGEGLDEMGVPSSASIVWMPDESTCCCSKCAEPFTMFRRRHHCRACGLICCVECAPRANLGRPSLLTRTQTLKRLCKDCAQQLQSAPVGLAQPGIAFKVKNTFINVPEASLGFQVADSFPF